MKAVDSIAPRAARDLGRAPVWLVGLAVAAGALYVATHGALNTGAEQAADVSARLKPIGQVALAPATPSQKAADPAAETQTQNTKAASESTTSETQPVSEPHPSDSAKTALTTTQPQAPAAEMASNAEGSEPAPGAVSAPPAETEQPLAPVQGPRYWYPQPAYQQAYPAQPHPYGRAYPSYPAQPAAPSYWR
ncbi:hypothetical protein G3480_12140 [Thiorhodococcus mannitoliphagus]|uniref:Uncharacterized protein n=1 Tax=Thiorhodococcus mannitoliphagus TaxID=329406 RepID=A0A6P1DV23_9GAMM|nr:hypothetical protein [Thiorhodococcus mannitoliphagus]NEX21053.1 hypothetical protein [Thiorhodococcus mannitoliphagus]